MILEPPLQGAELVAHLRAQPRIEVAERLVEQQHLGLEHQGAGDRHPLLLAAGQCGAGRSAKRSISTRRSAVVTLSRISALATWRTLNG